VLVAGARSGAAPQAARLGGGGGAARVRASACRTDRRYPNITNYEPLTESEIRKSKRLKKSLFTVSTIKYTVSTIMLHVS
jgi:hypothetical protein